jgi:hypothetical protein
VSKRLTFFSVLFLVVLTWGQPVMAAEPAEDRAENIGPTAGTKAPGDILWHCDVQTDPNNPPDTLDFQILGVETFSDTIYLTGGNSGADPNKIHVWTRTGGTCHYQYSVDQASLAGWGWRDLACDGQYLYASDSYVLAAFTVSPAGVTVNGTASITVNSAQMPTLNPVRAVCYDPNNDWFWAANFSNPIYAFDRSGNMMAGPYTNIGSAYGMAYDNDSPGGPWIWVYVQDSSNVYQFNPSTGTFTGVSYSGWGDDDPGVSGIAGGLCVLEGDPSKGNVTLLGVSQIVSPNPDEIFAMEIYLLQEDSLYWKPGYENYAPNGMPDIDMFQGFGWWKTETGKATFDGPCAVANCFKWFDSKYEDGFGGTPGDGFDQFPLVRDYMDQMPWWWVGYDDHDPYNINDAWDVNNFTPWLQGATVAPPPTLQPFVPGSQPPGGGLPAWGELVERIAWYVDLDGVQSGYCNHSGTRPQEMYVGIQDWLDSETFEDGSTLADTLCVNIWPQPTFELVEGLVEKCEDVILLLGFWYGEPGQEQQFIRGDINADGFIQVDDVAMCGGGGPFLCDDAADVNDDGVLDMTDCDYLFQYLQMGPAPPAPFPGCGVDPTPDGLGCAEFPICPGAGGGWFRVGGHWVTVAGVNSEDFLIAFSDPFTDNAEQGGRGRVLDGWLIPHAGHPYDHVTHNDEGNVSQDIYGVVDEPITPGGLWEIANYGVPSAPDYWIADRFFDMNVPPEFESVTAPWDSLYPLTVEVEYAIQVSPWDYRGDVAPTGGNGVLDVGDAVYILNYLFKSGSVPDPYIEGDTNCDGLVDLADAIRILNYLFKGGDILRCCDP